MTASGENDRTDSGPGTSNADTAQPQPGDPEGHKGISVQDLVDLYDDELLSSERAAARGRPGLDIS
jgi:hypothetical protein